MGDMNQLSFIKKHVDIIRGPILEVGSKDYGNTQDLRSLFPGTDYLGVDIEGGDGVDTVTDLTDGFEHIDHTLSGKRFSTAICFSVLEHCRNPFRMCENISRLLKEGGLVFVSVPFACSPVSILTSTRGTWQRAFPGIPDRFWIPVLDSPRQSPHGSQNGVLRG
jgi:SAM-dependent methyltransferase